MAAKPTMQQKWKRDAVIKAGLDAALAMFEKGHCIDAFDWGKSVLTADHIRELNETPGKIRAAQEALGWK